tara:strand:+ start:88 stop:279 length:192 start_codon:yes stop_codon:yes gene_type:complete
MIDEVAPVRGTSQAVSSKHIVERVYKNGAGKHIVDQTVYVVTLYDSNGLLTTITNSHKINYLV